MAKIADTRPRCNARLSLTPRLGVATVEGAHRGSHGNDTGVLMNGKGMRGLVALILLLGAASSSAAAERLRGAYFHHNHERKHLEDLKRHGIDTLLVKFSRLTPDGNAQAVARLKEYAGWSQELGLRFFPIVNLMGGEAERKALAASPRRETLANGTVCRNTPCPLDDRFWNEAVVRRGRLIAKLSRDHAIGAFVLDPEMYGADHTMFSGSGGCFCDGCWAEFFKGRGAAAPKLGGAGRHWHLGEASLLDDYRQWQSAKAQAMAQRAREAVHAVNPKLRLGVLLLDCPQWAFRAWAKGLGTEELPVYCFSETTYGNGFTAYVAKTQARFRRDGAFVSFVPGLWLSQFLPKELPGHLARMALHSGGYWLYTTYSLDTPPAKLKGGYRLLAPQADYWRAIAESSRALAEGAVPPMVRSSALDRLRARTQQAPVPPALKPVFAEGAREASLDAPATLLRGRGCYWILADEGEAFRLRLRGHRLGQYEDVPVYVVLGPDGQALAQGELPLRQVRDLTVTAKHKGVHALHIMSRSNTFSVAVAARHWAIDVPESGLPLCKSARRLHFFVPAKTDSFTVRISGTGGGEGVLVKVLDPDGRVVAQRDTAGGKGFSLKIAAPAQHRGKAWSATLGAPRQGIFEDARIALQGVPPFVSEAPQALLIPAK